MNLSSYKHLLYFVSSWVVCYPIWLACTWLLGIPNGVNNAPLTLAPYFRSPFSGIGAVAIFSTLVIGLLVAPILIWLGLRVLDLERWRVLKLLGVDLIAPVAVLHPTFLIWWREEVLTLRTFRGFAYLVFHFVFALSTLFLLGIMLTATFSMLFAQVVTVGQSSNAFSYWRNSVLWTGSEGLKFSPLSSVILFFAGIPMLNLTLQFSNFLARVWSIAATNALSNDSDSQRVLQALERAGKSVLEQSTDLALQTILTEGLSASSASGAGIGETRINLENADLENPKIHVLRVSLEKNTELLALYKNAPPNARDSNLWNALGTHASTALRLQSLLTRERASASEQERQRIARELHDSVAQALYGIALGTRSALEQLETNPEHARKSLEYAIDLADGGTAEMKTLLFALRPDALEEGGLVAALQKLGEMLLSRYKLKAIVTAPLEPEVSLEVKGTLYRIAQEAVHNTVKHGKAKEVQIRLENAVLEITDNGHGFDLATARAGALGIKSMRERAEGIGASLEITSGSAGTQITVIFGGAK
jgi:signal transduction histidine kinase